MSDPEPPVNIGYLGQSGKHMLPQRRLERQIEKMIQRLFTKAIR